MINTSELHSYFQNLEQQNTFSGVVLIRQGEQEVFAKAYGYASRAWKVPNTLNVRFDTASITKLFTSVAVLQMIDQGRLAFDTSVIDFLGFTGTAISPAVNVYHLLTHTSGIADDADEEAGEELEDIYREKPNYSIKETVDFLPQFVYKPPNFAPGQGCRYCNVSYILLGLMIEKLSGLSYRDYVRQNVFAPAGMTSSDFFRMDRVYENVAEGADPLEDEGGKVTGWKRNIYSYPPQGSPDGGAHVTAGDLIRFMHTVQAGKLLSPELTKMFFTPQVDYHDRETWMQRIGCGLWFHVDRAGRVVHYQKEGMNNGASGMVRHYPDQNITIALLSNMIDGAWEPIKKIHAMIEGEG
jgi:CubicO group peptidase (beta-lactamase class C family)